MENASIKDKFAKAFSKDSFERAFTKENVIKGVFVALAAVSIIAVFAIVIYLLYASIEPFREVGFFKLLFGTTWDPSSSQTYETSQYGILPMLVSTIVLTVCAVLLGGTIGVFVAIFMAYYCPKKLKGIYTQIINLLAGIPSIVYGFFGMAVILPMLQRIFGVDSATGLLAGTLILSIMMVPTVASVARNSLEAVPSNYYEGALALGCSKNQAVFKVCVPAAKKGIIAALILGMGRAIGETMAVQFVIGNTTNGYPTGPFAGFATLTSKMVQEFGYAQPDKKAVFMACGFVLLVFILIINLCIMAIRREGKGGKGGSNKYFTRRIKGEADSVKTTMSYRKTGSVQDVLWILSYVIAVIVAVVLLAIVIYILIMGVQHLTPDFLFGKSRNGHTTLAPAFVSTGMLIVLALVIALPLGVGAAIYLNEYAKRNSPFVKVVRIFVDTLAGIPSIVFGLFGYLLFTQTIGYTLLGGGIILALIILPTIIRSVEQSLSEVPDSMREASLALGAGKVRTIFLVVLPSALAGIVTSVILSIGKIVSESAALIFTAGNVVYMPTSYLDSGSSFAVYMYRFMNEGLGFDQCYATAVVLLILVIILNLLVTLVERLGDRDKGKPHPILAIKNWWKSVMALLKKRNRTEKENEPDDFEVGVAGEAAE